MESENSSSSKEIKDCSESSNEGNDSEAKTESSLFSPPLYIQRYLKVAEFIKENQEKISKFVDIGCNDLTLFRYLKSLFNLREIVLMDIDEELLKDNLWKVKPIAYDHLRKRPNPLNVHVISADAKIHNYNLTDVDLLTMIEVIEHLHEDELPSLIENVFHIIQPKYVFISTPNVEYNKYFVDFKPGQFRHADHKFEWDSAQFKKWALLVGVNYSYDVEFDGCGMNEEGNTFCTQIAILKRKAPQVPRNPGKSCKMDGYSPNVLLMESYPFHHVSAEERLQHMAVASFQSLFSSLMAATKESDLVNDCTFYKLLQTSLQMNNCWQELSNLTTNIDADTSGNMINKHLLSFILRPVENIKSDLCRIAEKIFYYNYSEDTVIFSVNTFCTWLEETLEFDFLRDVLQSSATFKNINGQNCMKIFLSDPADNIYDDYDC